MKALSTVDGDAETPALAKLENKLEGGLGLRQIRAWNQAALCKLLWKIHSRQDELWVNWTNQKLRRRSIWQVCIPHDCSWSWRKILKLRGIVRDYMCTVIGDGRESHLFYDCWLEGKRLCDIIDITPWQNSTYVSDWISGSSWEIPASFQRRHPDIADAICRVPIQSVADVFIWTGDQTKEYSINSAYNVIRMRNPAVLWHNIVWSPAILPRHSFILWLLFKGRLKTRDFLRARGMHIVDPCCGLCNRQDESIDHIFFKCEIVRQSWEVLLESLGLRRRAGFWSSERRWFLRQARSRSKRAKKIHIALASCVYHCWAERNRRIFRNEQTSPVELTRIIKNTSKLLEAVFM